MVRKVYHPTFHEIAGEWCDTRNAAKASYKLALKARRSSHPNVKEQERREERP